MAARQGSTVPEALIHADKTAVTPGDKMALAIDLMDQVEHLFQCIDECDWDDQHEGKQGRTRALGRLAQRLTDEAVSHLVEVEHKRVPHNIRTKEVHHA